MFLIAYEACWEILLQNLTDKRGDVVVGEKWQRVRAMEQLKRVIVQQAALAFSTFTLVCLSSTEFFSAEISDQMKL